MPEMVRIGVRPSMQQRRPPEVNAALWRRARKISDAKMREFCKQYLTGEVEVKHCAKFSQTIIEKIREILDRLTDEIGFDMDPFVLDPFAGVGGIHHLRQRDDLENYYHTVGIEIEWEWAAIGSLFGPMICCDWFEFVWDAERWGQPAPDFIVTSCTYGNRFADKHNARDGSRRRSYTHDLGRQLTANNSGGMQWGKVYRRFHTKAWLKCYRMLEKGGVLVLNVSDHVRQKKIMRVAEWHKETLLSVGFKLVEEHKVDTPRMRDGANSELRVDGEWIYVFRK